IEYAGSPVELPPGFPRERVAGWAVPGMVDLHSHVVSEGFGDINDMVLPVNAGLSTRPAIVPANDAIRLACASGVTTLFLIPGSGTSLSGFGVLLKTRTEGGYERAVLADPGGMKVAQTHNPERRGGDLGATRAGLYWLLAESNARARGQLARGPAGGARDFDLANLERVHARELPVLVHCAGNDGVEKVVRMWKQENGTRCVVSHGPFDGWTIAPFVAEQGVPVNNGPRTFDYPYTRTGRMTGTAAEYVAAGVPDFSLNTDAPVIPAEELFLQGSMSARLGADSYTMLRALTIHPARAFGIDDRVGSLEPGKHADVVVYSGDPLDPRSRVELVLIEGEEQYRRTAGGQWF
ncbi:MAG TPA: amidohydrolase family protein, partial [Planctomycetota bacterium]|nr:amidohydrolase family protein [Planctomycetota bacterium]